MIGGMALSDLALGDGWRRLLLIGIPRRSCCRSSSSADGSASCRAVQPGSRWPTSVRHDRPRRARCDEGGAGVRIKRSREAERFRGGCRGAHSARVRQSDHHCARGMIADRHRAVVFSSITLVIVWQGALGRRERHACRAARLPPSCSQARIVAGVVRSRSPRSTAISCAVQARPRRVSEELIGGTARPSSSPENAGSAAASHP